jgi:hypothetical protein
LVSYTLCISREDAKAHGRALDTLNHRKIAVAKMRKMTPTAKCMIVQASNISSKVVSTIFTYVHIFKQYVHTVAHDGTARGPLRTMHPQWHAGARTGWTVCSGNP